MSENKPPLGIEPAYIASAERIKKLAEAIQRYADSVELDTKNIRKWAIEILGHCEIITNEKEERKKRT